MHAASTRVTTGAFMTVIIPLNVLNTAKEEIFGISATHSNSAWKKPWGVEEKYFAQLEETKTRWKNTYENMRPNKYLEQTSTEHSCMLRVSFLSKMQE